jgi:hypothetical protein
MSKEEKGALMGRLIIFTSTVGTLALLSLLTSWKFIGIVVGIGVTLYCLAYLLGGRGAPSTPPPPRRDS